MGHNVRCVGDMKMLFKIMVGENEAKSRLGDSKRRTDDNIKMVLGGYVISDCGAP
jgi:hypothetical protein